MKAVMVPPLSMLMTVISKLKSGQRDCSLDLCTDHFINDCNEIAIAAHVALLFSAMLLHGIASDSGHLGFNSLFS